MNKNVCSRPAEPPDCATHDKLPDPLVDSTYPNVPPLIFMLPTGPRFVTPFTVNEVNVPVEVMFGCAAVVTVPAVVAVVALVADVAVVAVVADPALVA